MLLVENHEQLFLVSSALRLSKLSGTHVRVLNSTDRFAFTSTRESSQLGSSFY